MSETEDDADEIRVGLSAEEAHVITQLVLTVGLKDTHALAQAIAAYRYEYAAQKEDPRIKTQRCASITEEDGKYLRALLSKIDDFLDSTDPHDP